VRPAVPILTLVLVLASGAAWSETIFGTVRRTNESAPSTNSARIFSVSSAREPLVIEHADSAEYIRVEQEGEDILILSGRIVLRTGDLQLKADRITVNMKQKTAFGSGRVHIIESGRQMIGDGFYYDIEAGRGAVYDGASVMGNLLYRGKEIKTLDKDRYRISDGEFSPCAYRIPHFLIETKRMWIYPDKSFFMLSMFYKTGGVRVFYLPFAFRTMKGTGIDTFAGFDSMKGYFIQNTLERKLFKTVDAEFRADAYQFGGGYAAAVLGLKKAVHSTELNLHQALARPFTPDGPATAWKDYEWKHFYSVRERIDLKSDAAHTGIDAYFFNASDTVFNSEYIASRHSRSGIQLPGAPVNNKVSAPVSQDAWYLDTVHTAGPLTIALRQRWNLLWNADRDEFVIGTVKLPAFGLSWSRRFEPVKVGTNASTGRVWAGRLLNGYNLSAGFSWENTLFYDYQTNRYRKTETTRRDNLRFGRTFLFYHGITYSPSVELGEIRRTGADLAPYEKENLLRLSYAYASWSDVFGLSFHEFIPLGPVKPGMTLSRSITRELSPRPDSPAQQYGGIRSHTAAARTMLSIGPVFSWSADAAVNLLVRTNHRLDLRDRERYSELRQTAQLNVWKSINLRDDHIYSIRYDRNIQNTFGISGGLFGILNADLAWTHNWISPATSSLSAGYGLGFQPDRYTRITFAVRSANRKLYLYDRTALKKVGLPASAYRNVFRDLSDSFSVLNTDKKTWDDGEPIFSTRRLERTAFKLQSISCTVDRDLHCWNLSASYSLRQAQTYVAYYGPYRYWEHNFQLQIMMKQYDSVQYKKETRTDPVKTSHYPAVAP
jgi:hypothetical protein